MPTLRDGKTVFFAQLLGSTRAQPFLQDRAVKRLVAEQKQAAIASGCEQTQPVRVLTTDYVSERGTEYGNAWRETWTIANCRGLKQVSGSVHAGSFRCHRDQFRGLVTASRYNRPNKPLSP